MTQKAVLRIQIANIFNICRQPASTGLKRLSREEGLYGVQCIPDRVTRQRKAGDECQKNTDANRKLVHGSQGTADVGGRNLRVEVVRS